MTANRQTGKIQELLINVGYIGYGLSSHYPSVCYSCQSVKSILLWFIEGKQSTEKPGGAHCGESRTMRFEWEAREVIPWSTPTDPRNLNEVLPAAV